MSDEPEDLDGLEEGLQRGFVLEDPVALTRMMLDLYDHRCAVTGKAFPRAHGALPHPDLEVFLFQPLSHRGLLSPVNALLVEGAVFGLMQAGLVLITDRYEAMVSASAGAEPGLAEGDAVRPLHLPADRLFWPDRAALAYHRGLFKAQ